MQHTVNEKSRKNSENIRITYFKHYILSISNKSLFFLQYKFLLFFSISYNYQSKNTFHREVIMAFIGFFLACCCSLWLVVVHCDHCALPWLIESHSCSLWLLLFLHCSLYLDLGFFGFLWFFLDHCGLVWLTVTYCS